MKRISEKLKSGDKILSLAPLAGYTDLSFRRLALLHDCDLVHTEMVSAKALYYKDKKTATLLETDGLEPTAVQIFGSDPDIISSVIKDYIVPLERFESIDINMGCPAPKIVKNGDGSMLLKNPSLALKILESASLASVLPVSVKMRLGFERDEEADEIVSRLHDVGVAWVTVHGRTRAQYYEGSANWERIGELAKISKVPLIGNGDVRSAEDAREKFEKYEISGISIGRGSIGNPWIFKELKKALKGENYEKPSIDAVRDLMKRHLELVVAHKGERIGVCELRKVMAHYVKGMGGASAFRAAVNREISKERLMKLIDGFFDELKGGEVR